MKYFIIGLLLAASPAAAQWVTHNEQMVRPVPPGFVEQKHATKPGIEFWRYVPKGKTGADVDELISFETNATVGGRAADFISGEMDRRWHTACPTTTHGPIADSYSNGYFVSSIRFECASTPPLGKPSTALVRVIQGGDKMYVAMYEFRRETTAADMLKAANFLETVTVCDSHMSEHPCAR